jgi:hypothetical protein
MLLLDILQSTYAIAHLLWEALNETGGRPDHLAQLTLVEKPGGIIQDAEKGQAGMHKDNMIQHLYTCLQSSSKSSVSPSLLEELKGLLCTQIYNTVAVTN